MKEIVRKELLLSPSYFICPLSIRGCFPEITYNFLGVRSRKGNDDLSSSYEMYAISGIMDTADTVMDKLMEGIEVNENIKTQELAEEEERRERERIRDEQARE